MRETAGTLLYRTKNDKIEILLVHASGNYNKKAKWSIPKGLPEDGETLELAARRETLEETGVAAPARLKELGHVDYTKSKKRVYCFYGKAPKNAEPHPASWEIDRCEFVPLKKAIEKIHPDQLQFIERLIEVLS